MKRDFKYILVLLLIIWLSWAANAQNQNVPRVSDSQIAMQYYRNGEYNKAAELYKQLYYINRSQTYYQYYLKCLMQIKDFELAERLIKEQIKFNKQNTAYNVDLGYLYQQTGDVSKAKSIYSSSIKKLPADQHQVINLANAFINIREYTWAEEAYTYGKKILKGSYDFETELGQLYYYQRDYTKMVAQYLNLLKKSDQYLQIVQNYLQNAIFSDIDNSLKDILKDALLTEINQNPGIISFNELLIWLYIQENDFEGAFIQAKALDLRLQENGVRLINLARIATQNADFEVAVKAYQYVINKGKYLEFFFEARCEMLDVMYKRIILGIDTKPEDFIRMEDNYTLALQEMGTNAETIEMLKNLTHLKAFYLNKTTEAWFMLEDAVNTSNIDRITKGEIELELADIYLADSKVWDATFTYAKIEEENKNNPVGSEAKFRKARLAYFIGNFEWSMSQLDILKASTSKLIANDAAQLALFIYDNSGWDSVETALEIYARADLLQYQSKDSMAIATLDTLLELFPSHPLADDAWFLKGRIYQSNGDFNQAIMAYQKVVDLFYTDILADKSLFAIADIYDNHLHNADKALQAYQKLLIDFKGSIYTIEARKRFRTLRGDLIN